MKIVYLFFQMLRCPENLKPQNQSLTPFPVFFEGKSGKFVKEILYWEDDIWNASLLKLLVLESTFEIERRRLFDAASLILYFWCLGIQIEQSEMGQIKILQISARWTIVTKL